MAEKRNIFLVGPMGAGKSTIGRQLAQMLNMDFIDSDAVIEERAGASIDWIFDIEGEAGFRKREERIINELTKGQQGIVLSTGGGSVLSKENRNALSARGIVIYLETTVDKQFERTQRDKKRPLLQTEDPRKILEAIAKERNPLYEEIADITLQTDKQSAKVVATHIIELIDNLQ
ncbi:shikimate kinase AroK [[Haemophilus] ducreyi]|uniref:shikimate kinase AroK n=1 Tax=Haemophilus ducreyi TaxID=730 RepID=UPI000655CCDD|nr:shikimate kinase AroK [[Haemophilus] ducreyi]AKO45001.1 shikimate kinase [[Haemophilus] ducreyi]AKO46404.1 shikimate kinase [[Haemophilus] ducreyi]AKO47749.1 shikimate kinase [[Haemophilus] ducreyi]AKO49131.1 shikimate kinase [[Haemophilus] ducreyi]ANF62191.1 shikimate kinase [[Haemophilus] ducreyi]